MPRQDGAPLGAPGSHVPPWQSSVSTLSLPLLLNSLKTIHPCLMLISWLLSTLESCCRPLLAHLLLRPGRHPIPSASTLQLWKVCFCSEERAEAPSAGRPHGHHSSEGHIPR